MCTYWHMACTLHDVCVVFLNASDAPVLLQHILSEPEEIVTMGGQKLPLKCSVDYISFSAHTDYKQTSEFVRTLKPAHIVSPPSYFGHQ